MPVLEADGLTKTVGTGRAARRVLDGVSISVEAGELVAVLGRSGSGKSRSAATDAWPGAPPCSWHGFVSPSRFGVNLRYDVGVDAGLWVCELRARHGLSQVALAYRAGTTQQAISRIERGRVSPTVEMLGRLAAAAGEELVLDARRREVPFDADQLAIAIASPMAQRLERAMSWNLFAGEVAAAGARARERS